MAVSASAHAAELFSAGLEQAGVGWGSALVEIDSIQALIREPRRPPLPQRLISSDGHF